MVSTKVQAPHTTPATALELALGQPAIVSILKEVKRAEMPAARQFDRALRIVSPTKMSIMSTLCAKARGKATLAKVTDAQRILLDFLMHNRDKVGNKLSKSDWLLLSDRHYNLHLAGVDSRLLGRAAGAWSTAESIWDYCQSLEEKQNFGANNH